MEVMLRFSNTQSQASRQGAETELIITIVLVHNRVLRDGSQVHMPVHMLGFAYSYCIKLEVKKCNSASQERSSLLEMFIAVKVSLFRTGQKDWCALDECVSIHISKNACILNYLLQAAMKSEVSGKGLYTFVKWYITLMLYLSSDFEKNSTNREENVSYFESVWLHSVNSLWIQLACWKSGRDSLDKTSSVFCTVLAENKRSFELPTLKGCSLAKFNKILSAHSGGVKRGLKTTLFTVKRKLLSGWREIIWDWCWTVNYFWRANKMGKNKFCPIAYIGK